MYSIKDGIPHKEIAIEVPLHPPSPRTFYVMVPEDSEIDLDKIIWKIQCNMNHKEAINYDWENAKIEQ